MFKSRHAFSALVLVGAALFGFGTSVLADGSYRRGLKDYEPAPFSWTGLYVGVDVGVRHLNADVDLPALALSDASPSPTDWGVGGHIGYRKQFDRLVVGIEADYMRFTGDDESAQLTGFPGAFWRVHSDWAASIRGSLGYAMGRSLVYVTSGVAFTEIEGCGTFGAACAAGTQFSGRHTGWTVGAGAAYALTNQISARIEYLFTDFGAENYTTPGSVGGVTRVDLESHTARLGLSYRF